MSFSPQLVLRRLSALTIGLALLSGGCSGSSGESGAAFAQSYQRVTNDLRGQTQEIQERAELVSGGGVDQVLEIYREILGSTRTARDEIAALEPSGDFTSVHEQIVEVLTDQIAELTTLVDAAEDRNIGDVTAAAQRLTELNTNWDSLNREMERLIADCGESCE